MADINCDMFTHESESISGLEGSNNVPSCPPDSHCCSDVVCLRRVVIWMISLQKNFRKYWQSVKSVLAHHKT